MERTDLRIPVPGGDLVGWVAGEGPPVLLLHGGPAMSGDYLDPLADELVTGYQVAWYQQRGIAPSTESGPHGVDQHVRDAAAVLDHLGWDEALVVGHSWGGFLVVAVAAELGGRLRGAMAVDPLGSVARGPSSMRTSRTPCDPRTGPAMRSCWPSPMRT